MTTPTFHLHLTGLVQGVGFRPFVWQLARAMDLRGMVSNGTDGVHIYLNADPQVAHRFLERVQADAPTLARIQSARMELVEGVDFSDFSIAESEANSPASLQLTPDFGLCDACRAELSDPTDRRFGYAFATCTHCGPRYSLLRQLPYDRPATSMAAFGMCADCAREYHDPTNRRFYAQTNSCPNCPVDLRLFTASGHELLLDPSGQVRAVIDALEVGQTVAVKGIGGYLLLCDATHADAIAQLRARKHRPTKPLAVLYPNRAVLEQDCYLSPDEFALLTSPASPIVLLRQRPEPASGIAVAALAPGLSQLGVMLPYAPLLALIADGFGRPVVATSGNVSGSPLVYTDEQALVELPAVADLILTHNRAIVVPQDDSVIRLSPTHRQPILLRRSRGFAPTFVSPVRTRINANGGGILALGASLKSTFAWQLRGNTYISQYLGDLEDFDTQTNFRHTLDHFRSLFDATPDVLLADRHEGYFSTQLARELATIWGVPLVSVQHHEAHLVAVLAEQDLLTTPEPILGVVWDGTGYGTDGQIWGGEFMVYRNGRFERVGHVACFDALLGDKMPREPRLSAFSLAYNLPEASTLLRPLFTTDEWALYPKLLSRNRLKTSSVGRLFDAVAALLGLADRVSYEGEAALLLEDRATRYVDSYGYAALESYLPDSFPTRHVPTQAIITGVVRDVVANIPIEQIAAAFHYTLVKSVATMARQLGYRTLAFSGGVFQNALLVDWLRHELEPAHSLHFHSQLSPGDECISFGQLAHYALTLPTTVPSNSNDAHVLSHSR